MNQQQKLHFIQNTTMAGYGRTLPHQWIKSSKTYNKIKYRIGDDRKRFLRSLNTLSHSSARSVKVNTLFADPQEKHNRRSFAGLQKIQPSQNQHLNKEIMITVIAEERRDWDCSSNDLQSRENAFAIQGIDAHECRGKTLEWKVCGC